MYAVQYEADNNSQCSSVFVQTHFTLLSLLEQAKEWESPAQLIPLVQDKHELRRFLLSLEESYTKENLRSYLPYSDQQYAKMLNISIFLYGLLTLLQQTGSNISIVVKNTIETPCYQIYISVEVYLLLKVRNNI